METKTIGQLTTEASPSTSDYLEIEHVGVSGKVTASAMGVLICDESRPYATSAESLSGSSTTAVCSPAQLRVSLNAENPPPIYACRAWVNFNGISSSASITGTYTRGNGTTTTVCIATAHGYISGNIAYVDFTSGGGSDNSYIVTVVDANTFTVTTVSTSSIATSAFTLKRCPMIGYGNVGSISYVTTGYYIVNFLVAMPNANYCSVGMCGGPLTYSQRVLNQQNALYPPTIYACIYRSTAVTGSDSPVSTSIDVDYGGIAIFC